MKRDFFIIDAHQDIALNAIYYTNKDIFKEYKLHEGWNEFGFPVNNNTDIPRLKKGKVKLVFASIFGLSKKTINELRKSKSNYNFEKLKILKTGIKGALEQISFYHSQELKNKKLLKIIKTKKDYIYLKKSKNKIGFLLHCEGIDYMKDLDDIKIFYNLGVRSLALTWREKNHFGGGTNSNSGLTKLGKEALKLCQDLGIIIDFAHANNKTFDEGIKLLKKPCIVSHTNCYSLVKHRRNIKDNEIKKVAQLNGVICVSGIYDQVGGTTINDYIKHIKHIIKIAGIDYVGFGTDFDGMVDEDIIFIKDFEDVSKFKNVISLLEKEGFTDEEIQKISYKNLERIILQNLT